MKDNSVYQKQEEEIGAAMDVNLISKDMELNFSNKNDDEDENELKNGLLDNEETEDFKPEKFGIAPEE